MNTAQVLKDHSQACLDDSFFFNALQQGDVSPDALKDIFGQYFFWRNALHKWFGLCISKSPIFGTSKDNATGAILDILCYHTIEDIKHLSLYMDFLSSIDASIGKFEISEPTEKYINSFWERFEFKPFERACSALAGRELLSSMRSRIIANTLKNEYGIDNVKFWDEHTDQEEEHFWQMWKPLLEYSHDKETLLTDAKEEISQHVGFWDGAYDFYHKKATKHSHPIE